MCTDLHTHSHLQNLTGMFAARPTYSPALWHLTAPAPSPVPYPPTFCSCTSAKLLKRRWWVEALKYMALFYIPAIVKVLLQLAVHTTCKAAPGSPMPDDASAACFFFFTLYVAVLPLGLICLVAWAVLVGGARRTQIRRMLGIAEARAGGDCCSWMVASPGKGRWSDCCLHFWCLCCALAQEMRTVMHVEEGFSLPAYQEGPADGYCQVAMEPPEMEDMDRPLLMVVDSAGSMKDVSSGVGKV